MFDDLDDVDNLARGGLVDRFEPRVAMRTVANGCERHVGKPDIASEIG